ncbi:dienelactone hydrolase family protein [Streptomyces olivoreticuli]
MSDQQDSVSPATDRVTVPTDDGPMRIYAARPAVPADRAVVVLQEAFGVTDHIQDITRRFAARGYLALAPDLFHRNGVATLPYDQHAEAMRLIGAIGPEAIAIDVGAVLTHLAGSEGVPVARAAVTGFCFGGWAAFTAATAIGGLAAAVVFYGPGIAAGPRAVLDRAKSIEAPILLHVGAEDPAIPAGQVAAIEAALREAGVDFESYVYEGAGHAFARDAGPDMYRAGPARTAWERTYAFLDRRLPRAS